MPEILRNILRRKTRASLTILGIVIGVLALTVMGAMAEKMNLMVSLAMNFFETRVVVMDDKASPMVGSLAPMAMAKSDEVAQVDGVRAALPLLVMPLKEELEFASFGMPNLIFGVAPQGLEMREEAFPIALRTGRFITARDKGQVVLGSDVAAQFKKGNGDALTVRGQDFQVVGVLERTNSTPDKMVVMNLSEAQELFRASLPEVLRPQVESLANEMHVLGAAGTDLDILAERINEEVPGVKAFPPSQFRAQLAQALVILNVVILGSAVIALVVGGLSVINTMVMAVNERTREIGVKKALGATTGHILQEYLLEAALVGLVGGAVGLGLGSLLVSFLNGLTEAQGVSIFAITPRLALGALAFSVALGTLAGLYPAIMAARRNPVAALRSV